MNISNCSFHVCFKFLTVSGEDIQPLVSVNVLEKCVNKCLDSTTTYLLDDGDDEQRDDCLSKDGANTLRKPF